MHIRCDGTLYSGCMLLGWSREQPIHVVAADAVNDDITVVITAYRPDPDLWTANFRRRR